jgi:predicted nucleotidyltransferase
VDGAVDDNQEETLLLEDDRYILIRYEHFRAAAEYVAAAFAGVPSVIRVALFGSVASGPKLELTRRRRRRRTTLHEPKDVDVAVWIDHAADVDRLRVLRSRAVNQLLNEKQMGVAHHQVDVFVVDAASRYLGRLCTFNQCPKHKPECRVLNCGAVPFLRQHDEFVLYPDSLRPDRIQVLYDRANLKQP